MLQVPAALHALESLGGALEDHLQLLLPALVRLICIGKHSLSAFIFSIWLPLETLHSNTSLEPSSGNVNHNPKGGNKK